MSSTKLIRWSGLATIVGGLLYALHGVIGLALGLSSANLPGVATTGAWMFTSILSLASFILVLLGLVGLYVRQSEATGTLGFIGFLAAFIGHALAVADAWIGAFLMPVLAKEAPALAEAMTSWFPSPQPYTAGLMVIYGMWYLGWILFGIATMRARVLPRWGALLLIVGILIGFPGVVAAAFWLITKVVFGLGLMWLGYAVWSGTGETTG